MPHPPRPDAALPTGSADPDLPGQRTSSGLIQTVALSIGGALALPLYAHFGALLLGTGLGMNSLILCALIGAGLGALLAALLRARHEGPES
ncbi:MAG: hypothetical protein AAGF30_16050 [Pseudomonadota bacterium]